jgi:hypothetical protein
MTAPDRPSSATGAGLAGLSYPAQPQELPQLMTFDGPPEPDLRDLGGRPAQQAVPVHRPARPVQRPGRLHPYRRPLEVDSLVRHLEAFHQVPVSAEVLADPTGRCGAPGDPRWPRRGHRAPDRPGRGRHPRHRLLPSRGLPPRPRRRSRTQRVTADAHLRWPPASSTDAKFARHLDNDGNVDHGRDADHVAVTPVDCYAEPAGTWRFRRNRRSLAVAVSAVVVAADGLIAGTAARRTLHSGVLPAGVPSVVPPRGPARPVRSSLASARCGTPVPSGRPPGGLSGPGDPGTSRSGTGRPPGVCPSGKEPQVCSRAPHERSAHA